MSSEEQTGPLRILCLSFYPEEGPSVRHRIVGYRKIWNDAGVTLTVWPFLTRAIFRRRRRFGSVATAYKALMLSLCTLRLMSRLPCVPSYDVVIVHREVFPVGGAFFEKLIARLNRNTVFDLDDATWMPTPLKVDQRKLLNDPDKVPDTMAACRVVVVGNKFLARYAERYCRDVMVIPTPYHDLGGGGAVDRECPVVVWIGNVGNEAYLDILREPLQRLARRHNFVFRVIGSRDVLGMDIPGVTVEAVEWREDREAAWLLDSSIGVMPLLDREYERGKCAFKLIQYFSAGLPVVASPVGMNIDIVLPGENGFLASGGEEWFAALDSLLGDRAGRCRMGHRSYRMYRQAYTPDENGRKWLAVFRRLADRRKD